MKSSTLFFFISTAAIKGAYAGCYGGLKWGAEAGYANEAVDRYCDPSKSESFTADPFFSGQIKPFCYPLSGSKKADISIQWHGEGDRELSQGDCVFRLKNEINGCSNGGSSTIDDWTFT